MDASIQYLLWKQFDEMFHGSIVTLEHFDPYIISYHIEKNDISIRTETKLKIEILKNIGFYRHTGANIISYASRSLNINTYTVKPPFHIGQDL